VLFVIPETKLLLLLLPLLFLLLFLGHAVLAVSQCLLQNGSRTSLSSAFFLQLLTPMDFRSFSLQSSHLNFGIPAFLLASKTEINLF
jgi:hypothetical protein